VDIEAEWQGWRERPPGTVEQRQFAGGADRVLDIGNPVAILVHAIVPDLVGARAAAAQGMPSI
jgi:hypothetical protein